MVSFRIYNNSSRFIPYEKINWNFGPTVLLGRYIREKSTGNLYFTRRLSRVILENNGYIIQPSDPYSYFPNPDTVSSVNLDITLKNSSYYRRLYSESNLVTDIIFRNLNDYRKAVKELRIDQTCAVNIPFSFQIEPYLSKIRERFEGFLDTSGISACLYNSGD